MNFRLTMAFCAVVLGLFCFSSSAGAATFNCDMIISDAEFLDSSSMSLAEIQAFLNSKGGYIATYKAPNASGVMKSAAEIIYDAAVNNYDCDGQSAGASMTEEQKRQSCTKVTINPKLLLVLLQKEQSLIESKSPRQTQLDWATGYGCPDGAACNDRWKGFGRQVNSASLQFFDYMQNPSHYTYKADQTYTVTNTGRPAQQVRPLNQATAALYNYTPHVYNGNYNFFNLWMRYFTFSYPNNTLLQIKGEDGVWLIQNGQKRAFLSRGALTSRYDINKVIQVPKSELDRYPTGKPLKFPQYSLVRSPRGTVFLIVDDQRRGFKDAEALRMIGINPEEIVNASWDDINAYEEGAAITSTSSYPTGALLQDKSTGGIYYVADGKKAPLWDAVLLKTKFRNKSITPVSPEKLASFESVEPAIFSDGELLKSAISPAVYVIDNGLKRPVTSGEIFEKLGYKWTNVITVPTKILDLYPEGQPLDQLYSETTVEKPEPEDANDPTEPVVPPTSDSPATGTPEAEPTEPPATVTPDNSGSTTPSSDAPVREKLYSGELPF